MFKTIAALLITISSLAACAPDNEIEKKEVLNPYTFQRMDLAAHVAFATLHVKVPDSLFKEMAEKNKSLEKSNTVSPILNNTYSYPVSTRVFRVAKTDEIYPVFSYRHVQNKPDYEAMVPLTQSYTPFDSSYRLLLEKYEKNYQMLVDNVTPHENQDWTAYRYNETDWLVLDKTCHIFAIIAQGTYHEASTTANHANHRFEENCLLK